MIIVPLGDKCQYPALKFHIYIDRAGGVGTAKLASEAIKIYCEK